MREQTKKQIAKVLLVIVLISSIGLAVYSGYRFQTGFHNVDLARNLNIINQATQPYGLVFVDTNSKTIKWTSDEMYTTGLGQMKDSIIMLVVSFFLIGGSLVGLIK